MKKVFSVMFLLASLVMSTAFVPSVQAAEVDLETQNEIDIALTDIEVNSISDAELTEAEPSELPVAVEDDAFAEDQEGQMLLDVEGNGEVYYVDPVDGGKEYLANGESAHALLQRRALGINEENFAKLDQGIEKNEPSVCASNTLAARLRGRIVLRVDVHGEAWWILPTNCRAYYVGTHEAAYDLMRRFSLGVTKRNLARIRDTHRQRVKRAVRFNVYAYAQENDVTLLQAREAVKTETQEVRQCVKDGGFSVESDATRTNVQARIRSCYQASDLPLINRERLVEIKEDISEARRERLENGDEIRNIRVKELRIRMNNRQSIKGTM